MAEQSLPRDVEADLEIGDHCRAGRIAHEKAVADEEYRLAGEQLRHDTTLRIQQLSGDSYPPPAGREGQGDPAVPPIWYLPTGPLPPGRQPPAPAPPPSTVRDQPPAVTTSPPPVKDETPPQPAPVREESRLAGYPAGSDWSGQFKRNVLGLPGNGIYQSVGSRWRIGAQIPNADLSLSWRTPYLAEDMLGKYQGVAALKKVHPPDKAHGAVEAQQEVMSLPQEKEISPYVAPVIQSGFDPAFGWFVVTPYYANGTLQRRMDADTPLTLTRALVITEQVLQGLRDAFTWQGPAAGAHGHQAAEHRLRRRRECADHRLGARGAAESRLPAVVERRAPVHHVVRAARAGDGPAGLGVAVPCLRHPRCGSRLLRDDHRPSSAVPGSLRG